MAFPNGFGDTDLNTFFEDFEVPISIPSKSIFSSGILDSSTEAHDFQSQRSEVQVGVVSALVVTSEFTAAKKNDVVIADGVSYYISQIDKEADGRTSRIHLRFV